jgi:hypothetical protein
MIGAGSTALAAIAVRVSQPISHSRVIKYPTTTTSSSAAFCAAETPKRTAHYKSGSAEGTTVALTPSAWPAK